MRSWRGSCDADVSYECNWLPHSLHIPHSRGRATSGQPTSAETSSPAYIASELLPKSKMDDEELALALQAEEFAAARDQPQNEESSKAAIMGDINLNISKAKTVEDPEAQQQALASMPMDDIRREAEATVELDRLLLGDEAAVAQTSQPGVDDLVVQGMLHWFKNSFFKWVDQPPCDTCGGATTYADMSAPTPAEAADGAGRVEVYHCAQCEQATRFPRYNNPQKLLITRRGRCGEWAHTFLLLLRAAGYSARHVSDCADHVWCEYFSDSQNRWVHVDSCEGAWDKPLVYDAGWGKKMAYVFAAGRYGVADVTRRYVVKPADLPSNRTRVPETWLTQTLAGLNTQLRAGLDDQTERTLAMQDAAEVLELMSLEHQQGDAAVADLPGRQSGSEAWRQARGETGTSTSNQPRRKPPTTTRYSRSPDQQLPELFTAAGRLTGGACRSSGENGQQAATCLFDGTMHSKWLDFGGGGVDGQAWVEYRLLPNHTAVVMTHYDVISAEDCPERDPCDWLLECVPEQPHSGSSSSISTGTGGANSEGAGSAGRETSEGWVKVDQQQGQVFSRRHQLRSFRISAAARISSRQWRLRVTRTANPAAANSVQLSSWNMYAAGCSGTSSSGQLHEDASGPRSQSQLLYLSSHTMAELHNTVRDVAESNGTIGRAVSMAVGNSNDRTPQISGNTPSALDTAEALGTVQRILRNMQQNPCNPKYWQLSATVGKLQPVLQISCLLAVLFESGFRPALVLQGSDQQLRLVADDTAAANVTVVEKFFKLIDQRV